MVLGYQVFKNSIYEGGFIVLLKKTLYSVLRSRTLKDVGIYAVFFAALQHIATHLQINEKTHSQGHPFCCFFVSKFAKTLIYSVWRLGASKKRSPKPSPKGSNSTPFQIHDFCICFAWQLGTGWYEGKSWLGPSSSTLLLLLFPFLFLFAFSLPCVPCSPLFLPLLFLFFSSCSLSSASFSFSSFFSSTSSFAFLCLFFSSYLLSSFCFSRRGREGEEGRKARARRRGGEETEIADNASQLRQHISHHWH